MIEVFQALGVVPFTDNQQLSFSCGVLHGHGAACPCPIDILQGDKNLYFLPTLVCLLNMLKSVKPSLKHAGPLVEALLTGIDRRFHGYSERFDLILANATLPQCKLRWLYEAGKEHVRSLLYNQVCKLVYWDRIDNCSESDADSQGGDFFCFGINDTEQNGDGKIEVDSFLFDPSPISKP
jgi:hypothetical protein